MYSKLKFAAVLLLASTMSVNVIAQNYNFTLGSASYNTIQGSVGVKNLNKNRANMDNDTLIPVGFNFKAFGVNIDTFYIQYGLIGNEYFLDASANKNLVVFPALVNLEYDTYDKAYDFAGTPQQQPFAESKILTKLENTTVGQRIFVIEYKNFKFTNSPNSDSLNVQIRFFEQDNSIEYLYGQSNLKKPTDYRDTLTIGVIHIADPDGTLPVKKDELLNGLPSNPTFTTTNSDATVNGLPSKGTKYRFTPKSTNVEAIKVERIKFYPNPAKDILYLDNINDVLVIEILDMQGKVVNKLNSFEIMNCSINISDLPAGIFNCNFYFSNNTFQSSKFSVIK